MRKQLLLILLMFSTAIISYAQSPVKGTVTDSVDHKMLKNTIVSILRKSDSVLVKFVRADNNGNFSVEGLRPGKYILMATHPYLGDYFDQFEVLDKPVDLGKMYMTPKSKLLAEVILKSGSPIRIKGDTTVYTADSFKVRPGANVEELLRRLPGIQVDKNGQITAMGEKVKKVLVDGEEFFGSDPGIATKNLRADVVKEVEVFDKKSDQAEFTGIDDGVKDKTINLKLKEDKKKGYFGKIEAGGGLKDKYNNTAMLNAFKGKRKLAGYGIMSNTGQTNLDWQDAQNYGGGSDNMSSGISDDGGMYIMMTSGGDDSYYGGRNGIPQNWNGGLHYSNKFNNNKQSYNLGYKFSKVNAPGETTTISETFLPDSSWSTRSLTKNFTSTIKHAVNYTLDLNLDSMNSLKWTGRLNHNNTDSKNNYKIETFDNDGNYINNSTRNRNNNTESNSFNSTLLWKHKFKKLSRTLSVNTDFSWSESDSKGIVDSRINYFAQGGVFDHTDTTDQQNVRNNDARSVTTKIAYTEPIRKDMYLEISYSLSISGNTRELITSNKDLNDKYTAKIDSLSNSYKFNKLVNTPGLNLRINKKKYNIGFGASMGLNSFVQKDVTNNKRYDYDFTNFFPQASFTYKFKPSQSFRFNYNGSSTAPSLEQLQPTRVNDDPLNVYFGNPDLKQSFRHSFNTGYNSYNVLKERNIWTNLSFTMTQNAFVQYNTLDAGKRTYQTINANGTYYLNFYGNYGFKIKDSKWRLGFGPNLNANRNVDYVNGVRNVTKTSGYGANINLGKYVENKFHFDIGPSFSWQHSKGSVNTSANADYWQLNGWSSFGVTIAKKFEIESDANFEARQKDPRFNQNNNYTKWNASIMRRFMKDNALEVKFGVYDILNQNRGYSRNFSTYSFTENYYTTLKRYWLLTVTWNISKNGKPAGF